MGQLQRSFNRLYGLETDRPTMRKCLLALGLTVTAGVAMAIAFGAIALGDLLGGAVPDDDLEPVWAVARVPLGVLLIVGAFATLLRTCPNRHQPSWSWLAAGCVLYGVAVAAQLEAARSANASARTPQRPDPVRHGYVRSGRPETADPDRQDVEPSHTRPVTGP